MKALKDRHSAIKTADGAELLSCITHGIAAIEVYVTEKANLWKKTHNASFDKTESQLDVKLNDWLHEMTGYKLNQSSSWSDLCYLRGLNTDFKHEGIKTQAFSYSEMSKILNKFRTGIAKILFILHRKFNDSIPSRVIRGVYLPDVF